MELAAAAEMRLCGKERWGGEKEREVKRFLVVNGRFTVMFCFGDFVWYQLVYCDFFSLCVCVIWSV